MIRRITMVKNTANQSVPKYFKPARGTIIDYYRQVLDRRKWKNYLVITYEDKFDGYNNVFKFLQSVKKKIPFDYDTQLREHIIMKHNEAYVNHGRDGLVHDYFLHDHHTLHHVLCSKRPDTLELMTKPIKHKEKITKYITIYRNWYYE